MHQTHPVAAVAHVGFKLAALVVYVTCEWFNSNFVLNFVTCVLLLAADFWVCKNVSGRLLVGLRYWNEIDEEGVSTWRFESRDAEGMKLVSPQESTLFWYTLYGAPAAWFGLGMIAMARFSLEYLLIVIVVRTTHRHHPTTPGGYLRRPSVRSTPRTILYTHQFTRFLARFEPSRPGCLISH